MEGMSSKGAPISGVGQKKKGDMGGSSILDPFLLMAQPFLSGRFSSLLMGLRKS